VRITNVPNSGSWHGAELPILFKTAEDSSGFANTPEENAIQNYMQAAWAAFAKDPTGAFGNDPYNFPEYAPRGKIPPRIVTACNRPRI
jgi:carboxylesterase type B